jgi:Flp pilus assembly protein TadG
MKKLGFLRRDQRGAGAVEFALAAPGLIALIIGISQLGVLYYANADLNSALAAGARYASIYPRPSDEAIRQKIVDKVAGMDKSKMTTPSIIHAIDLNGNSYADISVSYSMQLNFVFFTTRPMMITRSRRVFTQPTS